MACLGAEIADMEVRRGEASPIRADLLAGLTGSTLSDRFRSWRGRSGRRYIFSIFRDWDGGAEFREAVVVAAERGPDGGRRILLVDSTETFPELLLQGRALAEARAQGANELHVHLLAASASERRAIVADLTADIETREPGFSAARRRLHQGTVRPR
jgi:hypothetical protein